jgi:hypothetical protein
MYEGNRSPSLTDTINVDGLPFNLTGSTVKLRMRLESSGTLKVDTPAVVVSAVNGQVRYDWAAADVDTSGRYVAWWRITLPSTFIQETPTFIVNVVDPTDVSVAGNTATAMIAAVRNELGLFNSLFTITDARIVDYLNEGQDWMSTDVTRKIKTGLAWGTSAVQIALPADYVRMIQILPDPNYVGHNYFPAYYEVDGLLILTDKTPRQAGAAYLLYEATYPTFTINGGTDLPRPGHEGLVAFAVWRCVMRFVNDRDAYARYATQVGTNAVSPEDMERLAEMWHQRYLAIRELLVQRNVAALMTPMEM